MSDINTNSDCLYVVFININVAEKADFKTIIFKVNYSNVILLQLSWYIQIVYLIPSRLPRSHWDDWREDHRATPLLLADSPATHSRLVVAGGSRGERRLRCSHYCYDELYLWQYNTAWVKDGNCIARCTGCINLVFIVDFTMHLVISIACLILHICSSRTSDRSL
jgi:hypothetical protein